MMRVQRLTLPEVVVIGVVILVAVAVALLPMLSKPHPGSYPSRVNCAGNLKQIGLSLLMYSVDYDGYYPNANPNWPPHGNFEPLAQWNYIQDGKVLACPSRSMVMTLASNSAYRYIGSGLMDDNKQAASVSLAYDEIGNHPNNEWIHVLFIDGHIEGAMPGTKPWAHNN